jgi:FSR family fosmidomycin resistance protein-like MFS transporter
MSSPPRPAVSPVVFSILYAISLSHLLNDAIQSVLPAIYPVLKESYHLDYLQIGYITLTFQMTASILQPFVGMLTDRRPLPYSLAVGMGLSLIGLLLLAHARSLSGIIVSAGVVGLGSSIFHPEASRVARLSSGGQHGFAQSIFQVGGNAGSFFGPMLAAYIVVPYGQRHVLWFTCFALLGFIVLMRVGRWYAGIVATRHSAHAGAVHIPTRSRREIVRATSILIALIFSKYFYLACMTSYYTFYLIDRFHVSKQTAPILLAVFLGAVAAGTIIGGPVGDRIGRRWVIWVSILGVAPFTLLLPHVDLFWTVTLSIVIGLILASAMSAILVYAQELIPGRIGLISGLFFGLAFGMAGIASAVLGKLADRTSIQFVFQLCAWLPLIGLLAALLPDERHTAH